MPRFVSVMHEQPQSIAGESNTGVGIGPLPQHILTVWMLSPQTHRNPQHRQMYLQWVNQVSSSLYQAARPHEQPAAGWAFIGRNETDRVDTDGTGTHMVHMDCAFPATLALGVLQGIVEGDEADRHLRMAESLTATCVQMYETPTGLAPEQTLFSSTGIILPSPPVARNSHLLQPHTVQSIFLMWRATHDPRYRQAGWRIFEALETHCRGPHGYSGVANVFDLPPSTTSIQQSVFLTQTLKYLLLLFAEDSVLPLDDVVFSQAAHPFPLDPL
jgi:mannosyl-oligosaccharide alpha-1,2-mannosidase